MDRLVALLPESVRKKAVPLAAGMGYRVWVEPTIKKAIHTATALQKTKGGAILNILGEHLESKEHVERDVSKYLELVDAVAKARKSGLENVAISIKPTQFGFHVPGIDSTERDLYTSNQMWRVVDAATAHGIPIEIDAESSESHDFTYDLLEKFAYNLKKKGRSGLLGVAVQANYDDALDRLKRLMALNPQMYGPLKFRLVKGIYAPEKGDEKAVSGDRKTLAMFKELVAYGLEHKGDHHALAIGTHHEEILKLALDAVQNGMGGIQIQMLKGIRVPVRMGLERLARKGVIQQAPWLYIPIGTQQQAGPYASRRLDKAFGLLKRTALDFISLGAWTGKWFVRKPK